MIGVTLFVSKERYVPLLAKDYLSGELCGKSIKLFFSVLFNLSLYLMPM